jgi:pimeloyl-ACP methyl ester carboxylesterase
MNQRNEMKINSIFKISNKILCLTLPSLLFAQVVVQRALKINEISTPKTESMVDVGGRKLHCIAFGNGQPAVVLISGFNASQNYWNPIIPDIAGLTKVVTYDRAGIGKSEMGDLPCDGFTSMKELRVLLSRIELPSPYLIVGHSLGGRLARIFASLFPDDIAGLILIDSGLWDPRNPQLKTPIRADRNIDISKIRSPKGAKSESQCNDLIWRQAESITLYPKVPLTVLTAENVQLYPGMSEEAKIKAIEQRKLDQEMLSKIIEGGKHIIVAGSGHIIMNDKPKAVIDAVIEMIHKIREN